MYERFGQVTASRISFSIRASRKIRGTDFGTFSPTGLAALR
jgi:hypothetical protein